MEHRNTICYRLTVAYRGTLYAGWQRQKNALAIQQVIEDALGDLLALPTTIHGAGRTDTGVHASGQTAHLRLAQSFPEKALVHGTNHRLPTDIRIVAAHRMPEGFHARKSALAKEYVYCVYLGRVTPPLANLFAMPAPEHLDLEAMRQALHYLHGRHDFSAFALAGGAHTQPWRRLFAATVDQHDRELRFRFVGDGFLRGMVRALVGTLLEIGKGKKTAKWMAKLLTGRPRSEAGPSAEARGLILEQVFYPPEWRPLDGYES